MTAFAVAPIVEGHGDVIAVPVLLRALRPEFRVCRPIRVYRNRIEDHRYMQRYFCIADANIRDAGDHGGVLVLIDSDDDCPAELGPRLQEMSRQAIEHRRTEVVLAKRTFESWILGGGAVESGPVDEPEERANPKQHLKTLLGHYSETVDQPRLTSRINSTAAAASCPSFAKLQRALASFLSED